MMLMRFLVKNFLSFDKEVEFSMLKGRTRKHPEHIVRGKKKKDFNILRAALIYGANASGKSNFIMSIAWAQKMIVEGARPNELLPFRPFKLKKSSLNEPTTFSFEIKVGKNYYAYGFEFNEKSILSEWLYSIPNSSRHSEKCLFERSTKDEKVHIDFGIKFTDQEEENFLHFIAQGTRPNQLFLTECEERNFKKFHQVYTWFRDKLLIIAPETQSKKLEFQIKNDQTFKKTFASLLNSFDTGISGIELVKMDNEHFPPIPPLDKNFKEGILVHLSFKQRFLLKKKESGELEIFKIMTKHRLNDSEEEVSFELHEESDGTLRMMQLLPPFIDLLNNDKTFLIDEVNRSLHPNLVYDFIKLFLDNRSQRHNQFIATTHELSLLDLNLLRRDEIWFMKKDAQGVSSLYSLEEFSPRYDKDIRKGYRLGRFGGIPIIKSLSNFDWI